MGYKVYNFSHKGHRDSEADEFFRAAEMARRGVEKMHALASEMEDRYSERMYGMRHDDYGMRRDGYGERYGMRENYPEYGHYGMREEWDEPMMHERRRRDAMGRYM